MTFNKLDTKQICYRAEKLAKAYLSYNLKINFNLNVRDIIDLTNDSINLNIEVKSCFYYRHRSKNNKNIRLGVFKLKRIEYDIVNYYIFIQINNSIINIDDIKSISIFIVDFNELRKYLLQTNKIDKEYCYISVNQLRKIRKIKNIKKVIKNE